MSVRLEDRLRERSSLAMEQAVFGTTSAEAISALLDQLAVATFGCRVASILFYEGSSAVAVGVEVEGGMRAVLKCFPPTASGPHLRATRIAQSRAHRAGLPVPRPLFEELQTIGTTDALVAVDEYLPAAPPADARDPAVRRKLAEMLAVFIQEMSLVATDPELSRSRLVYPVDGDLWPTPHSPVFDFESSREGAGWIDEFALAAKARMRSRHGEVKTGHADWRVFNVRPASGSSPAAIYDLDSVIRDHEPLLVGRACAGYTTGGPYFELPRFSQALEFLRDYEECSGRCFSATERREVMAMAAYHLAYVARCAHSLEHSRGTASAPPREGSSREILLSEGAEWLSWDGELDPTISPRAS